MILIFISSSWKALYVTHEYVVAGCSMGTKLASES